MNNCLESRICDRIKMPSKARTAVLEKDRDPHMGMPFFFLSYTVQKSARAETAIARGKMGLFKSVYGGPVRI